MKGRLITIGSFDGVHTGHQALLQWTIREARKRHLRSLALTFSIPPRMVLDTPHPMQLLSHPGEKEFLLYRSGIDEVVFLNFDTEFSHLKPFYFFKKVLIEKFQAKGLVVGMDFRFGQDRTAGAAELVKWGQEFEIPVWVVPAVKSKGGKVSSRFIRQALLEGDYRRAQKWLGHPYLIIGHAEKGRGVGRQLGYPTLNLAVPAGKILPMGVYAVRGQPLVTTLTANAKRVYKGVCNIGRRPTLVENSDIVVEVHWLGEFFPANVREVAIELVAKLRDEKKFPSANALQRAIRSDVKKASAIFRREKAA